jgi:hypothetical protein
MGRQLQEIRPFFGCEKLLETLYLVSGTLASH